MRLNCPLCGPRDHREFSCKGAALARPNDPEWSADWDEYLHLRDNPVGLTRELWHHAAGCASWLVVTRDTVTHDIKKIELARDVKLAEAGA